MEKLIIETKYGEVTLQGVMIDVDGTNLEDGTNIKIDGETIDEVIGSVHFDEDSTAKEVEEYLEEVCNLRNL